MSTNNFIQIALQIVPLVLVGISASFIMAAKYETQIRLYTRDWAEAMWRTGGIDQKEWTGPDEVAASINAYIEGKHIKK